MQMIRKLLMVNFSVSLFPMVFPNNSIINLLCLQVNVRNGPHFRCLEVELRTVLAWTLGLQLIGVVKLFRNLLYLPTYIHDASFARALLSNCKTTDIVLPWETNFYKELFSDEPFSQSLVPEMPIGSFCDFSGEPEPHAVAKTIADVARFPDRFPVFSACVGSTDDGPFDAVQDKLRSAAVQKLLIVLRHDLNSSATGRHILALGSETEQLRGAHKIVEAVLGTRAPATLVKRANALLSYLRWFDRLGMADIEPFSEACIWRYFEQLKEDDAPCTKGSSALSAFRFAFHLLGFEGLGSALNSRRLIGICELMLSRKRLLKQADRTSRTKTGLWL